MTRGRPTLRRFVFETRPSHAPSPSPDPIQASSSQAGPLPESRPPRSFIAPPVHTHHHRPTPILTSRPHCGIRDSSLPTRLRSFRSPDDLSASVSSMAYSEMASSPAVDFLSAFAQSTVPAPRSHQTGLDDDPPGLSDEGDEVAGHVLGAIIGRGGFSVVREAVVIETGRKVAVKIIRHAALGPVSQHQDDGLPNDQSHCMSPASVHPSDSHHHPFTSFRDRSSSTPVPFDSHLVKSAHLPLPTSVTESLATALLNREIDIWSALKDHPHLVPLLSIHRALHQTFIFMPLCDGGNLLQMLNAIKTDENSLQHSSMDPRPVASTHCASALASPPQPSGLQLNFIRHIFQQIVHGLKYLHLEAGVTHKDIKLENILVHEGKIKISDFGLAVYPSRPLGRVTPDSLSRDLSLPKHFNTLPRIKEGHASGASLVSSRSVRERRRRFPRAVVAPHRFVSCSRFAPRDDSEDSSSSDEVMPTAAGSLAYTPPEQLRSDVPLSHPSLDIWALGCVLYALLQGHLPFEDDFEPRLRLKIMNGQYSLPSLLSPSPRQGLSHEEDQARKHIGDLLKGCLAVDKTARWTIEQIANCDWVNHGASDSPPCVDTSLAPAGDDSLHQTLLHFERLRRSSTSASHL